MSDQFMETEIEPQPELPPIVQQGINGLREAYDGFPAVIAVLDEIELMRSRERAIRTLHAKEMFGDCVEDGDPFPCHTIRVLNWRPE